jgi:hypothetical protein
MAPSKKDREERESTQIERFKEAARKLGANEDEAAFDEALRRIARQKPKPEKESEHPRRKPTK